MRKIDIDSWSRREHYEFFSTYGYPHWGMVANVDLTAFYPEIKKRGQSFTIAIVYSIARASNAIKEFRYRIRDDQVIEHEVVHPGFTFLMDDDTFSFCITDYLEDFSAFAQKAAENVAYVKANPWVRQPASDDLLYTTAIPWVTFTSFLHPMRLQPEDSIPRFAWGKYFKEGKSLKMPLGVQGHHALMDGVHVGKFYMEIQEYFNHPETILDCQ
jgi:chloramphenicol O-acetyltransferase type A